MIQLDLHTSNLIFGLMVAVQYTLGIAIAFAIVTNAPKIVQKWILAMISVNFLTMVWGCFLVEVIK